MYYYDSLKQDLMLQLVMLGTLHLRSPIGNLGQSTVFPVLVKNPSLLKGVTSYLARGVSCVPQGISQVLARPCGGVHNFHWKAWVSLSPCRVGVPVGLGDLLPHNNIEAAAGLVAKHKSSVVIIPFSVDEEGATEVHGIKLIITWKTRPIQVKNCSL